MSINRATRSIRKTRDNEAKSAVRVTRSKEDRKNIMVLGSLGIGKSTSMNVISGGEPFKASDLTTGCTQGFNSYSFDRNGRKFKIIDTPGLND